MIHETPHRIASGALPRALTGLLIGASALAVAAVLPGGMTVDYGAGQRYAVTMETYSTSASERQLLVDGEPREVRGGSGSSGRTTTFSLAYADEIVAQEEGAPTRVRRAFESASAKLESRWDARVDVREVASPFDGVTLMLSREEGVVEATVEEGDAPDQLERLDGHRLRLPLDGLLPRDDIETGDSWDIAPEALQHALGAGLSAKLTESPGGDDRPARPGGRGRGDAGERAFRGGVGDELLVLFSEGMDWEVTGTLTDRSEEFDGHPCAVIEIEAAMAADLPDAPMGRGRRGRDRSAGASRSEASAAALPEGTVEAELEGELLWDAARSCPVRLTLSGEVERESNRRRDTARGSIEMTSSTATEIDVTVTVLPVEGD